jgi:hypothetical protein
MTVIQYTIDILDVKSCRRVGGIVTGPTVLTTEVSNPVMKIYFFLLPIVQTGSGAHQTSGLIDKGVLSQVKVTGA